MGVAQLSLGTLRGNVRSLLNEAEPASTSVTTFWTDAEINQWLNDAKNKVFQPLRLIKQASGTVTSGTAGTVGVDVLNLPADWTETVGLTTDSAANPGSPSLITEVTFRDFFARGADTTATGQPVVYYQIGETTTDQPQVKLWPIPDQTYNYALEYYYAQPDMSADTDLPGFDGRWNHILVTYAASKAWFKGGRKPAMGEYYENLWESELVECHKSLVMGMQADHITRYVEPLQAPPVRPNNPLEWY